MDSAYIMWKSIKHNNIHGPKSAKFRDEANKEKSVEDASVEGVVN